MSNKTILDSTEHTDSTKTVLDRDVDIDSSLSLSTFRGSQVIEEFEAIGAEADVYLIEKDGKQYFLKLYRRGIKLNEDILKTIQKLSRNHKYFAELFEYGFDENLGRYYELSEYIKHGSLEKETIDSLNINTFIRSLNESLTLLHQKQIIHRDLKPNNILLRNIDPLNIVLVDFGVSSVIADDMTKVLTTLKGTYAYTAPEVMSGYIGKEVDYFSFGMILLELLAKNPLSGLDGAVILHTLATSNIEIPNTIDNRLKKLLQGLLTRDPKNRWGYNQVNEWIEGKSPEIYFDKALRDVDNSLKYKFKDVYYTKKELARAFVKRENFEDALKHIGRGYITKFLEKLEENDEAIKLDEEFKTPIEKLVFFIYSQKKDLPFSLYGIVIDQDYMFSLLIKYTKNTLDKSDKKIFKLLQDDELEKVILIYEQETGASSSLKELIQTLPQGEKSIYEYLDITEAVKSQNIARVTMLTKHQDVIESNILSLAIDKKDIGLVELLIPKVSSIKQSLISKVIDSGNSEIIKLVLNNTKDINSKNIEKLLFSDFRKYLDKKSLKSTKNKNEIIIKLMTQNKIETISTYFTSHDLVRTIYEQIDAPFSNDGFDDLLLKFLDNFEIDVDIKLKNNLSLLELAIEIKDNDLIELLARYSKPENLSDLLFEFIMKNDKIELFKKYEPFTKSINDLLYRTVQEKSDKISKYLISQIDHYDDKLLSLAIKTDQFNIVKELVENGFRIDSKPYVLDAIINDQEKIAKYLIEAGANINLQDDDGNTLLHFAIQKKWTSVIEDLLERINTDYLQVKNGNNLTVLDLAIQQDDIKLVELLSSYIILPQMNNSLLELIIKYDYIELYKRYENLISNEDVILYHAIKQGKESVSMYLIQRIENLDNRLLFLSIATDQVNILRALAEKGMDLNTKGKYGDTPLIYAYEKGRRGIVKYLIDQKVDLNVKDKSGNTALMLAVQKDWEILINQLLNIPHIDINAKNNNGDNILFYALQNKDAKLVSTLLERGISVTNENKQGDTPLHFYLKKVNAFSISILSNLLHHGARLDVKNASGHIPLRIATKNAKEYLDLCVAIENSDIQRVDLLLKSGADVNTFCKKGILPLGVAVGNNNDTLIKKLIDYGADANMTLHWFVDNLTENGVI